MARNLYEHERHPLDIIAEEEAKTNKPASSKMELQVQSKIQSFPYQLSFNELCYEVAMHLGRQFVYTNNKARRKEGWPTTQAEMITFLEEKGMKE